MIALDLLKLHLKVEPDLTTDDALIMEMEAAAVAFFQNETGRYFGPVAELTEVLSPVGLGPFYLQAEPLPDSVETPFLLERRSGGEWEEVGAADYDLDGRAIYPRVFWAAAARAIRVTYWGGYEESAEPADVRSAVCQLVTRMYAHRMPVLVGTTVAELPASAMDVIRAHRAVVV